MKISWIQWHGLTKECLGRIITHTVQAGPRIWALLHQGNDEMQAPVGRKCWAYLLPASAVENNKTQNCTDPGTWVILLNSFHRLCFPRCLQTINLSLPCELALVQHASLVAKPELAALVDLPVTTVFDLERKIVNLYTLRPARNLLQRSQGLSATHASHAAWKKLFAMGDHLARTALRREEKSAHLIWNLTRRFVQEKDAHGPACRAAYGKFVALAEGLLVEHVLVVGLKVRASLLKRQKTTPKTRECIQFKANPMAIASHLEMLLWRRQSNNRRAPPTKGPRIGRHPTRLLLSTRDKYVARKHSSVVRRFPPSAMGIPCQTWAKAQVWMAVIQTRGLIQLHW